MRQSIACALALTASGFGAAGAAFIAPGVVASAATTQDSGRCRASKRRRHSAAMSAPEEHDILLRVARGEVAERAPVWLMRQVASLMQ